MEIAWNSQMYNTGMTWEKKIQKYKICGDAHWCKSAAISRQQRGLTLLEDGQNRRLQNALYEFWY